MRGSGAFVWATQRTELHCYGRPFSSALGTHRVIKSAIVWSQTTQKHSLPAFGVPNDLGAISLAGADRRCIKRINIIHMLTTTSRRIFIKY